MKWNFLTALMLFLFANCFSQEKVSSKKFEEITLLNRIDFIESKYDQPKFGCGFLLKYKQDTFAITAKHLLKFIKSDEMKGVSFDNGIKKWSMFPLLKPAENVVVEKLLNENKNEPITEKTTYEDDWLIFSLKENHSKAKPLEFREKPLIQGEKFFVVGWTRKMESGEQRVYEFEYFKTLGKRILLNEIIVPEQFGGLSGAPVVDENGKVVGVVSGKTTDPDSGKSYFSPCDVNGLKIYLENNVNRKDN
ncbi:trypsin-like serine protease [Pedobacter sp. Leaf250]|uniref:trypsin-like serine protease n=1 Tax=Pedobacter sp. Leaf250 TaxID=2876559 RepID=UPI001E58FBF1|nr:trypsin-like serine protease [Pedobacter sp. Leaf250]